MLKFRLADHLGYVIIKVKSKATDAHFNLPGNNFADLSITVIEKTTKITTNIIGKKENHFSLENSTHSIKESTDKNKTKVNKYSNSLTLVWT